MYEPSEETLKYIDSLKDRMMTYYRMAASLDEKIREIELIFDNPSGFQYTYDAVCLISYNRHNEMKHFNWDCAVTSEELAWGSLLESFDKERNEES
ncbi:MAG: hypothetical protein LIP10_03740 [Clostridiales bacterium]|nr:hypothetical protein [Clostridiales bacterium]